MGAPVPEQRQRVKAFGGVAVNACVTASAGRLEFEETLVNRMRIVCGAARHALARPTLDSLNDAGLSVQHCVVHGHLAHKRLFGIYNPHVTICMRASKRIPHHISNKACGPVGVETQTGRCARRPNHPCHTGLCLGMQDCKYVSRSRSGRASQWNLQEVGSPRTGSELAIPALDQVAMTAEAQWHHRQHRPAWFRSTCRPSSPQATSPRDQRRPAPGAAERETHANTFLLQTMVIQHKAE